MIDFALWNTKNIEFLAFMYALPRVRIHAAIARYPWARLWYLARAYDPTGSGKTELSFEFICFCLGAKQSTVYEWLREGKKAGAFRSYSRKSDSFTLYLGSLFNTSKNLGLKSWGTATDTPIWHLTSLVASRSQAMKASVIERQYQSMVAAKNSLQSNEKKFHHVISNNEVMNLLDQPFLNSDGGQLNQQIIHLGKNCLFTSAGFIPVGASQAEIANDSGWSISTVQRRLIGLIRRQIVQSKEVYRHVREAMDWEFSSWKDALGRVFIEGIGEGRWKMSEQNGLSNGRSKQTVIHPGRFFSYMGKVWIYRCNLYLPSIQNTSQKFLRAKYRNFLSAKNGVNKPTNHKDNLSDLAPPKEDDLNLSGSDQVIP